MVYFLHELINSNSEIFYRISPPHSLSRTLFYCCKLLMFIFHGWQGEGRLKLQRGGTQMLGSMHMTYNYNNLPKDGKLDPPAVISVTGSSIKPQFILMSSVEAICLPRLAYITNRLKYCCKWRPCSDTSLLRRFSTALSKWSLKLKLS